MAANGRFGGHIVSGHIDGTGTIQSLQPEGNAVWVTIAAPASILHLIVNKGSISIDGISLTVAYVDDTVFKVSVIPHTGEETTLLHRRPGDVVNLENDVIGKYVEKLLLPYQSNVSDDSSSSSLSTPASQAYGGNQGRSVSGITMDFLTEHGY
jgi:riboflavin synthase